MKNTILNKSPMGVLTAPHYPLAVVAICAGYLVFQLLCIPYMWLGVDEFWFAHHIYLYTQHLPYRDFMPYKTVLGYYLLSPPLLLGHGLLEPVFFVKDEIALLNTMMLAGLALLTQRMFRQQAIFYSLLLIISNHLFLMYSTELRADMQASWLCLVAVLLLVNNRARWAGVALGLAFLISQKSYWYIIATNLMLVAYWLFAGNKAQTWREWLRLNLAFTLVVGLYVAIWSAFSSFHIVMDSVFYEGFRLSRVVYYSSAHGLYWQFILRHGPILILLLPLTILGFFIPKFTKQCIKLTVFGLLSLVILARYQQFFPYNIVFLLPAYFVLYAGFFSWLLAPGKLDIRLNQRALFWFFVVYMLALISGVFIVRLPLVYLTLLCIPALLWRTLHTNTPLPQSARALLLVIVMFAGVFVPLQDFGPAMHAREALYQQASVQTAHELLQNENYIAGTFLFYNQDQTLPGFKNLLQSASEYARTGDPKLLPLLPACLDITPKKSAEMLADLQQAQLKFLLNNVRIASLPKPVLAYLRQQYQHYWGSIYLYAPTILSAGNSFKVKFSGNYQLESTQPVVVDQQIKMPGKTMYLQQGKHLLAAKNIFRLRLLPDVQARLDPAFMHDCVNCFLKEPLF